MALTAKPVVRTATLVAVLVALGAVFAQAAHASGASPVASAGGTYVIAEGDSLALDAGASTDPELDALSFAWDLDNDGAYDDAFGARPVVSWASLRSLGLDDDGGPFPITVEVDDGTSTSVASTGLNITNVAPTVEILAPRHAAAGARFTLDLAVDDPGADTVSSWTVAWGDGRVDTMAGAPGPISHVYQAAGLSHALTVTVTDDDGTWGRADAVVAHHDAVDKVSRYRSLSGAKVTDLGPSGGALASAHAVVVGPDGMLYVAGQGSATVERYDPATNAHLGTFVAAGSGGLADPRGLAFGAGGDLFVTSSGTDQVLRYDGTTGASVGVFVPAGTLTAPRGLAFGPDGHLYVADTGDDQVERYDGTTGAALGAFTTFGPGDSPSDLTWGRGGELLVSLAGPGRVERVDATSGAPLGAFAGGLTEPAGLTVGPDGALWVTDHWTDQVLRFDGVSGAPLGPRITEPTPAGPRDVAFVATRMVAVVDGLVVNTTGDASDIAPGNGQCDTGATTVAAQPECTLRAAMEEAQAASNTDVIAFSLPPVFSVAPGVYRISPGSPYPLLTNPVVLDGATQSGWSGDPIIELDGAGAVGATAGVVLNTSDSFLRGFIVYSFADEGLEVDGTGSTGDDNVVLGNWIGFDALLNPRPNADNGILVTTGSTGNVVRDNVVGHSTTSGILVRLAGTDNNVVTDNIIGLTPDLSGSMANGLYGIELYTATSGNRIEGNTIARSANAGIWLAADVGGGNTLIANEIRANSGLAIDLAPVGVTPNSSVDAWVDHPVLTGATELTGTATVAFDIDLPAGSYRVDLYTNPSGPDPTGHGEAEVHLGHVVLAGHPGGLVGYEAVVDAQAGDLLSATTTVLSGPMAGATSELAGNVIVAGRNVRVNSTADGADATPGDGICWTGAALAGGRPECTLRAALQEANTSPLVDRIRFAIPVSDPGYLPGPGAFAFAPGSALPPVTAPVVIDGTSQPQYVSDPVIRINGTGATGATGLLIDAPDTTVQGVILHTFDGAGIEVRAGADDVVIDNNVLSQNDKAGIVVVNAARTRITANKIGVEPDGVTPRPNGGPGVALDNGATAVDVGGTTPAEANVIAHNTDAGVQVATLAGPANAVLLNTIRSNGGLGIDLGADGVTLNSGADAWLDHPVITSMVETGGIVTLNGTFDGPAGTYRFDFYKNPGGADPSGHGEGEQWVATSLYVHPGGGPQPWGAAFPGTSGDLVSISMTRRVGADFGPSSEFSAIGTVISNDPPVAAAGGPYTIAEGDDLVLDGSGSTDPDGDTLTYDWDLDNDGSYDDASGATPTVAWPTLVGLGLADDGGPFPVGLRVDDTITSPDTDGTNLTITNTPPSLTATGPATIGAGQLLTLTLGATDPGADTVTSWTVNWGDGTTHTGPGPTATHTYAQAGPTHPVTVSAVDEDGTWWAGELLVPSYLTGTLVPLSADGAVGIPFGSIGGPFDTVIGPDGNLYVTDYLNDTVERYDPATGTHLGTFVTAGSGGLNGPIGVAFGADGHLYVASSFTSTVERYDGAAGTHLGTFVTAGSGGLVITQDLVFGPDGHLYVGGRTSGAVHRYDGTTGASMGDFVAAGSGGLVRPEGLAFVGGDLLVASGTTDEVLRYDPAGSFIGALVAAGSGGLDAPGGVALGPDGDLYVTSELTDEVLRYTPTGTFVGPVAPPGAGGLDTPAYPSFAPAHLVSITPTHTISGVVFEDLHYGGGPGRDQTTATGVGRGGATVELYDSGTYRTATVTAADGSYALPALDPGVYAVRVVNRSVDSSRAGSDGSEVPVQTFRADGPSEAIGTGADKVGGEEPQSIDAPANDTTQSLADLQAPAGVFTQSLVDVDATGGDVTGIDFGFSLDTVVNTNSGGQGSLRRVITNANLLGDDTTLAQDGHTAGLETAIFEIPTSDTGHSISPVGFTIEPTTPLPPLVTPMALDASTQVQHATENRPVIELVGTTAAGAGLEIAADDSVIRGFAINRFDTGVTVTAGADNAIVDNHLGPDLTGLVGEVGNTDGLVISGATGTLIGSTDPADTNLISGNVARGVVVDDVIDGPAVTAAGTVIEGNLIGPDATGAAPLPAVGAGTPQTTGIELVGAHGTRIGGKDPDAANVIAHHDGTGVAVIDPTAADNAVVANSMVANGALGIDLLADGVTANDPGDGDAGPNDLLNHPSVATATRTGATAIVLGSLDAPAGVYRVDLFANPSGTDPSGSGEGEVHVGSARFTHTGGGPELWGAAVPAAAGDQLTATATADLGVSFGATSELSPAATVVDQATARAADRSERRSDPLALGGLDPSALGPGVAGSGLTFDGADDRLAGPALDITSPGLTLAGWVHRTSAGPDPRVVSKGGAYELFVDSGTNEAVARLRIGGTVRLLRGGSAPVGDWHHLAATWDGSTARLYVDGVEVDSTAAAGALGVDLSSAAVIGSTETGGAGLAGHLDQVVVLHRPLSPAAVAAHATNVNDPATFVAVGGQQTSATDPWTVTGAQTRSGSFALEAPQTNATSAAWAVASGIDEPGVVFESWWWFTDETAVDAAAGTRSGTAPTDEYEAALVGPAGWELRQRQGATETTDAPAAGSPTAGQWVKVEIWTDQNGDSRLLIDDVEVTGWTAQGSALASGSIGLRAGYLSLSEDWWVDDAQARKLVTPEPLTTVGPLDRE